MKEGALRTFIAVFRHMPFGEKATLGLSLFIKTLLVSLDLIGLALLGISVSLASGAAISTSSMSGKALRWFESFTDQNLYAAVAFASIVFFFAKGAISIFVSALQARLLARYQIRRATGLYRQMLMSPIENLEKWSAAKASYGVGPALDDVFGRYITAISSGYGEIVMIISIAGLLTVVNPGLFLLVGSYFVLVTMTLYFTTTRRQRSLAVKVTDASISNTATLNDLFANFRQLFVMGDFEKLTNQFERSRAQMSTSQEKINVTANYARYVMEMAMMVGVGLLVLQRTTDSASALPASVIALFIGGALRIAGALLPLQGAFVLISNALESAKIPLKLLKDFSPAVRSLRENQGYSSQTLPRHWRLSLRNVSYRYPGEPDFAIAGINLEAKIGDYVAVVGKSGAGKSTLADIILGLRTPEIGSCTINGLNAREFALNRSERLAYVPQRNAVVQGTVAQNIALRFDGEPVDEVKVWEALKKVGLAEVVKSLPNSLETVIDETNTRLSGGQLQRLAIARALYLEPKVLVLDEATSALDDETEEQISNVIRDISRETLLIVIAHRLTTVRGATQILEVTEGSTSIFRSFQEFIDSKKDVSVEDIF
jgi:ABC-type bacteriocin/lantibiotic exporter with double-glycine peptidase domain